jgi:phosphonate transport system permease protein
LFVHSLAYLIKAFAEAIENVKPEVIEALKASGASWWHIAARGVFPSIKTSLVSWTALRFEINIGQSTILGFVGAGGIGYELAKNVRMYNFHRAGLVVLVLFLLNFGVEFLFRKLKLGIDKKVFEK